MGSVGHDRRNALVRILGGAVVLRKEGECVPESRGEYNRVNSIENLTQPTTISRSENLDSQKLRTVPFTSSTPLVSIVDAGGLKPLISGTTVTFCGNRRRNASNAKWGSVARAWMLIIGN